MKSTSNRGPVLRSGQSSGCGHVRSRRAAWALGSMLAVTAGGFVGRSPAAADEPAAAGSGMAASYPGRGANMQSVEARYGAPAERRGPIGKPPITRWDYPGFVVFFEYEHVIHSVVLTPGA